MGIVSDLHRDAKCLWPRGIRAFAFLTPTISTYRIPSVSLTLPLFIGGALQLVNDIVFYTMFRHVRPPEEMNPKA